MNKKIIFIAIFSLVMHICCGQQAYTELTAKRYLSQKEKKFRLSKQTFILSDTSIISKNIVYINVLSGPPDKNNKQGEFYFSYMRFFEDGRVFFSFPYLSLPKFEEFCDTNYGKFGLYRIKKNIIKIELYQDKQWGMTYIYAKKFTDNIQFYLLTGRGCLSSILFRRKSNEGGFYKKQSF